MNENTSTCRHCQRTIRKSADGWIDPEATGDDRVWRETCDQNDEDRIAAHEPTSPWTLVWDAMDSPEQPLTDEQRAVAERVMAHPDEQRCEREQFDSQGCVGEKPQMIGWYLTEDPETTADRDAFRAFAVNSTHAVCEDCQSEIEEKQAWGM